MGLAHLVPDDAHCYRSPQGKTKTVLASAAAASSATASRYGSPDKRPETSANIHRTGINPKRSIPFLQGLESAIDSLGCPYWSQRLTQVHQEIAAGNPVWLALKNTQEFSPLCLQLVRTGEASGSLDIMLHNLARHHSETTLALADNLASLVGTGVIDHHRLNYRYAGGGDVFADFSSGRRDERDGIRLAHIYAARILEAIENAVFLFLHPNKGGAFGQLFRRDAPT
ncbi:type IV pilin biogenesis protein [Salmonella enterica subsp. enterica]|uniref:Type IV pilin biogenesis protein n=1 Tax=Salmonella enterica I TaxID=59201 RepID=A0A379WFS8_SALET|nr:type IV pilin biogenesis protein [Salmonella enterica subsp. enterica]